MVGRVPRTAVENGVAGASAMHWPDRLEPRVHSPAGSGPGTVCDPAGPLAVRGPPPHPEASHSFPAPQKRMIIAASVPYAVAPRGNPFVLSSWPLGGGRSTWILPQWAVSPSALSRSRDVTSPITTPFL